MNRRQNTAARFARLNKTAANIAVLFISATGAVTARAIEGGLGRSLSGGQIAAYQALVPPPEPGVLFTSLSAAAYSGEISGSKTIPRGGKIHAGVDASCTFVSLTLGYDWPGTGKNWNVMSSVVIPWAHETLEAHASLANGSSRDISGAADGFYDLMFRVAQASYRISPTQHISISLDIWAPTGRYEAGDAASLSLDNWTYVPTVSWTKLFAHDWEFSGLWALEYYSPNRHDDYHSGTLSRVEVLGVKHFGHGLGAGFIGSWMQQISDDTGALASMFNGFRGRSFGIGPIITWSGNAGKIPLSADVRWIREFKTKNMPEGNIFEVTISSQF